MSDSESGSASSGDSSALRGPLILARMVGDALASRKQGDSRDYNAIIDHLSVADMQPVVMGRWLQALTLCVSELAREEDRLVGATLRLKWYDKEPAIVELYKEYLANLVSAQTYYLCSVLQMLLKQLWTPSSPHSPYASTHDIIQTLLSLVPTAPSVLMPLLSKAFPFRGRCTEIQELAVRNVLHMTSYCPTLRDEILQLVIHQMLSIDVEVAREGEGEGGMSDSDEKDDEMQFELEGVSGGCGTGGCRGDEAPRPCLSACYSRRSVMADEGSDKLDVMMTVTLEYLQSLYLANGVFVLEAGFSVLQAMLKIFERVILPTHACSHVQFLLFHLTSVHKAFPGYFLDFLWQKFQEPSTPAVLRQTVAAYIASFIARAKFVELATAKLCLTAMLSWIHQYLDGCSREHCKADISQHGSFYALCQAAFYTFVFRHRQLLDSREGADFVKKLNFDRVVSSKLNPLKMCLPSIVELFASLTSHHEIVFCFTIIEQNKRLVVSSQGGGASQRGGVASRLDCFFPFDPYGLTRSGRYIAPLYQEWEECEDTAAREDGDHASSVASLPLDGSLSTSFNGPSPPLPR